MSLWTPSNDIITAPAVHTFRKSQPVPSQMHVNRPLTNMSVAFIQDSANFIARRVFPNIPSENQTNSYWIFPKGTYTRDEMARRAPGTMAAEVGYAPTTSTFNCDFWSVGTPIADQVPANSDAMLSPDQIATQLVTRQAEIRLERFFATTFMATSVWTLDVTGVAGTPTTNQVKQWNDAASTPIKDVATYSTTMQTQSDGFRPNIAVMGRQVWDALKNHPEILDRRNRGQTEGSAKATLEDVAALFELEEIMVCDAVYNSAIEGATISNSFIIGKSMLLAYRTNTPAINVPSAGYTFAWTGMVGGGASRLGTRIRRYRDERVLSWRVECDAAFDMKAVCPDCGIFFTTLVA